RGGGGGGGGRGPFAPVFWMSVCIYAYSKRVSRAGETARRCHYDPAYQWLTGLEAVNYHTLSDFRVAHQEALEALFIQVLGVLSQAGWVRLERGMQDGAKIKAQAGDQSFRRQGEVERQFGEARPGGRGMGGQGWEEGCQ